MNLLRAFVLAAALPLAGCVTTHDPNDWYDSNAIENMGRIIDKSVVTVDIRKQAGSPPPARILPVPIGGTLFFVVLQSAPQEKAEIKIYEYLIETPDGRRTPVLSEYFVFDVGSCVKLFESSRPSYPRIAHGHGCSW